MRGHHALHLHADPSLPAPATTSCPFPIILVVAELPQQGCSDGGVLEIHNPVSQASSHWYTPPKRTTSQHIKHPGTTKLCGGYI